MFKSLLTHHLWRCLFILSLVFPAEAAESVSSPSYDARLTQYEYPFPVSIYAFKSQRQDLEMAYMLLPGEQGRPLVTLLHGKNFNGAYWQKTAEFLNRLGFHVLIPDQIGFGKSSKPDHYQYSFALLASNTRNLIRSLGYKTSIIIGHSMGGMLATRFALMYPLISTKLILVNPIGLENYLDLVAYKDVDFFYEIELNKTAEKIKNYQQKSYYAGQWNERYAALTEFMIGQINHSDWPRVAWNNAMTYDMLFAQPVIDEMPKLSMPVSLIIGERDRTGPGRGWVKPALPGSDQIEMGRYDRLGFSIVEKIPHSNLFPLKGLGHLPQIENFEVFSKVLKSALGN